MKNIHSFKDFLEYNSRFFSSGDIVRFTRKIFSINDSYGYRSSYYIISNSSTADRYSRRSFTKALRYWVKYNSIGEVGLEDEIKVIVYDKADHIIYTSPIIKIVCSDHWVTKNVDSW